MAEQIVNGQLIGVAPIPEEYTALVCPNCKAGYRRLTVETLRSGKTKVECHQCREEGTMAYFTPGPQIDTEPRLITREVHIEDERKAKDPLAPAKAMSAAITLLAQAAIEESLDISWHTMRVAGARDEAAGTTTFVAVVQAIPRAPHDRGGVVSGFNGQRMLLNVVDEAKEVSAVMAELGWSAPVNNPRLGNLRITDADPA